MPRKNYRLRLVAAGDDAKHYDEIDTRLDLDDRAVGDDLHRHFVAMSARAARQQIERELADMPWLHKYTLLVFDPDWPSAPPVRRFREG